MSAPDVEGDLVTGLAQMLADAGVAQFDPTTASYTEDRPAVFAEDPPQWDGQAIVLRVYPVSDGPLDLSTVGVQVFMRGTTDPTSVTQLSATLFDTLHDRDRLVLNGIPVVLIQRRFAQPMGTDAGHRYVRADTYYVQLVWPTPNRIT